MPTVRLCGFRSREWLLHVVFDEACYNPTQTIRLLSHVFREASTCNRNITRLLRTQTVRLCCFFAVNDFQNFWTDADWRNMWESDSDNPPAFTCIQRSTRLQKEHHENPEKESKAKATDSSVAVGHDLTVGMGFVRCTQWRPAWTLFVHHLRCLLWTGTEAVRKRSRCIQGEICFLPVLPGLKADAAGISGDYHKIQQEKAVNLISMVTTSYEKWWWSNFTN